MRMLSVLKNRNIDKKDLIIAILLFLFVATLFFVWFYLKAERNPFEPINVSTEAGYQYRLSIYDPNNLKRPLGVSVSSWGDVFIADSVNHRVAVFDRKGKFQKHLGGPGKVSGKFNYPSSVAVSGRKLYVADFYNQRVQVLDFDGKVLNVLPAAKDRGKLGANIMPITLMTDSKDNLYVSDLSVQRILVFDAGGNLVNSFGTPGSNPGELSYVNGIALNEETGRLYLSNSNNARVDEFTLEGKFVKTLPASKGMVNPKGIAFNKEEGRLYIADTFAHKVVGVDEQGQVVAKVGQRGVEAGSFNFPTSVSFDDEGRLYVADRENNRVEVYSH